MSGRPLRERASGWPSAIVALWILLAIVPTAAQPAPAGDAALDANTYRIVRWATADGLPQNTVTDIAVLSNRELWLATFGGLARFDGDRFQVLDIASDERPCLPTGSCRSRRPARRPSGW